MKVIIIVALVVIAIGVSISESRNVTYRDVLNAEWESFKTTYNKTYSSPSEEKYRFKIFLDNRLKIAQHNKRAADGQHTYTLAHNQFTDMESSEIVRIMNGYKPKLFSEIKSNGVPYESKVISEDADLPRNQDWRRHGYVTPVKDQGQCGSCWAFSSTGALEGQHYRKTGNLISLSEQNLIDCSAKYGNQGCNGGLMELAFEYIHDNHGVDTENSYPYEAHNGKCRFKNRTVGADDKGYVEIPSGNEKKLMQAVATIGPVSVAIDASQESFHFYDSGVYNEPRCGNDADNLDHGVLVIGYGEDPVGGPYWIVKNSWSETWGDSGYIKMARNRDNQCGIATKASYPLV
ncbi:Cathepsin L, partial [Fragariocoptes setiger]